MLTAGPPPPGTLAAWAAVLAALPASMQQARRPERVRLKAPQPNAPLSPIPEQKPPCLPADPPSWAPFLRRGILFRMPMSSDRLKVIIALPGWSLAELARRWGMDSSTVRQMARGKWPVPDDRAAWLERVAAAWEPLEEDLRQGARVIGCDRGKYVRRPLNFRPLTDAEAVQLERLAEFHRNLDGG